MTQEQFFARYKYDRIKDRIGGGGVGNVYKAFDTRESETVALKIAEVKPGLESLSLQKEVELASSLERHVNIARYSACYRFDLPNGLFDFGILQYYPLGNLSQLVKSKKLSEADKENIAQGIISGIQHLHSNNVVHRDLKSANILMAEGYQGEYVPKIADFGLSKQFTENEKSYFSNSFAGGSLLYVAPEQLEGKELRKNVDLWSLGVVLYELFVGETPFQASVDDGSETARAEIISKIKNASIPAAISTIPSKWQEVIRGCLVTDPTKRTKSIEDVMSKVDIAGGSTAETVVDDKAPPKPKPKDQQPNQNPKTTSILKWCII
ncbi:MAG: serine/threonine-protein kinase [Saprospiraceae bacterium]|nr:serine/threonine-protein kinase [Saprospiraceae bacterium]